MHRFFLFSFWCIIFHDGRSRIGIDMNTLVLYVCQPPYSASQFMQNILQLAFVIREALFTRSPLQSSRDPYTPFLFLCHRPANRHGRGRPVLLRHFRKDRGQSAQAGVERGHVAAQNKQERVLYCRGPQREKMPDGTVCAQVTGLITTSVAILLSSGYTKPAKPEMFY